MCVVLGLRIRNLGLGCVLGVGWRGFRMLGIGRTGRCVGVRVRVRDRRNGKGVWGCVGVLELGYAEETF